MMKMIEAIYKEMKGQGYPVKAGTHWLCKGKLGQVAMRMPDNENMMLMITQPLNVPVSIIAVHNVKGKEKVRYDWQDICVEIKHKTPEEAAKDIVELAMEYYKDLDYYYNKSCMFRVSNEEPSASTAGSHVMKKYGKWYFTTKTEKDDAPPSLY